MEVLPLLRNHDNKKVIIRLTSQSSSSIPKTGRGEKTLLSVYHASRENINI